MIIDKSTVICLLDKSDKFYEDNVILLNTLSDDTCFYLVVEDCITAEYYDESKDVLYRFKLDYDYFSSNYKINELEERRLSSNIEESLLNEYKLISNFDNDNKFDRVFINVAAFFICCILFLLLYLFYYIL